MAENHLNFLLMGKTGHGKSKTGNSLLNRPRAFKASASTTSETKEVKESFAQFTNYVLNVIDGPGLEDTDMNTATDKETAAQNMETALAMCDGGVDVFLFVTKFGARFTEEDKSALEALKGIFGDSYMNHVIVVMTGGDSFENAIEEDDCKMSFDEWCRKQKGPFRQLYDDCSGRVVLFNNFEKDETRRLTQRQMIVQLTCDLKARYGRYTSKSFEDAKAERDKMIVEHKAPELGRQIQEKASLLVAEIEHLSQNPSDSDRDKILTRIQDLKREIEEHDKGTGVLDHWMKQVEKIEASLGDVVELQRLARELEEIRESRKKCSFLSTFLTGLFSVLFPPLAIVSGVLGKTTSDKLKNLDDEEKRNENKQLELTKKRMLPM